MSLLIRGVAEREPTFPDGLPVGRSAIRPPLRGQVFLGFGKHVLLDEPFVGQGEGRILRERFQAVPTAETHPPGLQYLHDDLVQGGVVDAEAELPPGAVVLGEGRGKWQKGQASRWQTKALFSTA